MKSNHFFSLQNTIRLLLLLLFCVGVFFRFYHLSWGAPFYFHPDERNIASAITQLHFPHLLNPHFFAYGSFPIYLTYITGVIINVVLHRGSDIFTVSFENALLIGRFYTAVLATSIPILLYYIGKQFGSIAMSRLLLFFAVTSVGLLQFARFGTVEMWQTFFSVILFLLCLSSYKQVTAKYIFLYSLISGLLIGTKVSSVVLLMFPLLTIIYSFMHQRKFTKRKKVIIRYISYVCFFSLITCIMFVLTNPYTILDFPSFQNSINYESEVALGKQQVFYTQGFIDTIPILFHVSAVYPFLLNPLLTGIMVVSFVYLCFHLIKNKSFILFLLILFFLILFLSQAFLFVKWTRYLVPTLPFIYIMITLFLLKLTRYKKTRVVGYMLIACSIYVSTLFFISYVITVVTKPDTRIEAAKWSEKHLPHDARILSETYDIGITPFNSTFSTITLYDFYSEDTQQPLPDVKEYDYIILASPRILRTRLRLPTKFPKTQQFYKDLVSGKHGFTKIYQTPCDMFCTILYLGNPVLRLEETTSVFDRPTVQIFKNENTL